jgi:hypothetical protein
MWQTKEERGAAVVAKGWRIAVLVVLALAGAAVLALHGPIPQDPGYFGFADHRTLLGIPNACNVLSNLTFAVVGASGLWALVPGRATLRDRRERMPWFVFFAGVAFTSAGSAWFHVAPSIDTLVWDRLPMAVGFTALLAALVAERIDARAGALLLWPLVAAGMASVGFWWASERAGAGDLRPYLLVQFYPLTALPLILALFPAAYTHGAWWLAAFGLYLLAKIAEIADERIFGAGGVVSGHTVKHLLAAGGIGVLAWMVARRRSIETGASSRGRELAPRAAAPAAQVPARRGSG